jgi:hypothetical protein
VLSATPRLDGPPARSAPAGPDRPSPFSGIAGDGDGALAIGTGPSDITAWRIERSAEADLDPGTYRDADCCAGGAACEPGAGAADQERWPALVLGRPAVRWTEPGGPPSRSAVEVLVDEAVATAERLGCRSLVAPWCVDRGTGSLLHASLAMRGAAVQRRAYAHAIDLSGRSVEGFVGSLPRPVRQRRQREASASQAGGHRLAPLAPGDWDRHRPAAEQLAAELRAGGPLAPDHAGPPVPAALTGRSHVWAAFHGDELRAFAVFERAGDTLWLTARGLARDARGFPAALLFHLVLHEVPAAAADLGVERIEYGVSPAGAWVLRGCEATAVYGCALPIGIPGREEPRR